MQYAKFCHIIPNVIVSTLVISVVTGPIFTIFAENVASIFTSVNRTAILESVLERQCAE